MIKNILVIDRDRFDKLVEVSGYHHILQLGQLLDHIVVEEKDGPQYTIYWNTKGSAGKKPFSREELERIVVHESWRGKNA